jgi:hypothetical protein
MQHGTGRQAVIAHDAPAGSDHESAGSPLPLVASCAAFQPHIERRNA